MSGTYVPDVKAAKASPDGVGVLALAATVGLAAFVAMLGLALSHYWLTWLGMGWLVAEGAFRWGIYLGARKGYEDGQTDMWKQISAW